jgi:hypothetical protein
MGEDPAPGEQAAGELMSAYAVEKLASLDRDQSGDV